MAKIIHYCGLLSIIFLIGLNACKKENDYNPYAFAGLDLPEDPFNYESPDLPNHFLSNHFSSDLSYQNSAIENSNAHPENPITNEGATLGRVLFYDKSLSKDGTRSCASCHIQAYGFSDSLQLSLGYAGEETKRHSMALANAQFYIANKFNRNESAPNLEAAVLMAFQDSIKMDLSLTDLVENAKAHDHYKSLFNYAFGNRDITSEKIGKAIAQFIRSIISANSQYDQGRAEVNSPLDDFPNFSDLENQGKSLFMNANSSTACMSCHITEAFISPFKLGEEGTTSTTNNGTEFISIEDTGVFETTLNGGDIGKFKVASLHNIGVRPPYMHDGRFSTLEEVIDHYSTDIQDHPNLHPRLRDEEGNPIQYNFSNQEKSALVAFLHTLTDSSFLTDEKFSNPFVE